MGVGAKIAAVTTTIDVGGARSRSSKTINNSISAPYIAIGIGAGYEGREVR